MSTTDSTDISLIQKEYAPNGHCQCSGLDDIGCPFCNPELREAWHNSFELEKHLRKIQRLE